MSRIVNIPSNKTAPACSKCHAPFAVGIFVTAKGKPLILCGGCSLSVRCSQIVLFNYPGNEDEIQHELFPPPSLQPEKITRTMSPLTAIALRRAVGHDPHFATLTDQLHKGNVHGRWAHEVVCCGCHITYRATRTKKCPACGTPNTPEA